MVVMWFLHVSRICLLLYGMGMALGNRCCGTKIVTTSRDEAWLDTKDGGFVMVLLISGADHYPIPS